MKLATSPWCHVEHHVAPAVYTHPPIWKTAAVSMPWTVSSLHSGMSGLRTDRESVGNVVTALKDYSKNQYLQYSKKPTRGPWRWFLVVPGDATTVMLEIMQFLKRYEFLLLSHDPWEWGSLGVEKLCNSLHPLFLLVLTLVMGLTKTLSYKVCIALECPIQCKLDWPSSGIYELYPTRLYPYIGNVRSVASFRTLQVVYISTNMVA